MGLKTFELGNNFLPKQPLLLFPYEDIQDMVNDRKLEILSEKEKLSGMIVKMKDELIERRNLDI